MYNSERSQKLKASQKLLLSQFLDSSNVELDHVFKGVTEITVCECSKLDYVSQ